MRCIKLIFAFTLLFQAFAVFAQVKKELPLLKAKQSLDNIRLITKDGKFTYYQRRSGDLQIFTNYSNENLLSGEKLSQFSVSISPARRKILITKDETLHTDLRMDKNFEIYLADLGKTNSVKHGIGRSPKLHQNDGLLSFYRPQEKQIHLKRLHDGKVKKINLVVGVNEFFTPQVFMPTPNDLIYSDINEEGREAFLMHSLLETKTVPVYKASNPGSRLEACMIGTNLYIGEFSRGFQAKGSKISKLSLFNNKDFQNMDVLYQSLQEDIGNMVCQDKSIYFIKTLDVKKETAIKVSEVAKIDLDSKKVTILTELERVTQLIKMDEMILSPYRGNYYIIEGNSGLTDDSIKKEKR